MNKARIKTNLANTAANITYYGGTIGAGLGFYSALDNHNPLAIAVLVVFIVLVEGLLRTLTDEVLDAVTRPKGTTDTAAAAPANTDGGVR